MRIIQLGNAYYYVGLEWKTVSKSDNYKYIIKLFDKNGYYSIRDSKSGIVNIGYSEKLEGRSYKKCKSLASDIADAKKEPWLGMFKLDNGLYWFIAVRDNQMIIPNGDVIGTKEEVKKYFDNYLTYGEKSWDSVIYDGTEADLLKLLTGYGVYVLPVKSSNKLIILVIVFLLILLGLYFVFKSHENSKPKVFIPKIFTPKTAKIVRVPGYKLISKPINMYNKCINEHASLVNYYGWKPVSLFCTDNNMKVVYKRQYFANADFSPKGNLSLNGNSVTKFINFNLSKPKNFRNLKSLTQVLKSVLSVFQIAGIHANIVNVGDKINITFTGNTDVLPLLFKIPTFRIISINFTNMNSDKANVVCEVWHN